MSRDERLEQAKSAINAVFGCRTLSKRDIREDLEDLQSDIEAMLDTLSEDE
jgi:hypothetical protein